MTERLYYADSHIHEFEATVLSCTEDKRGFAAVLDKTAFFPEGGGQPADTGHIGNAEVFDVQEKNGEIIHYCSCALKAGDSLSCAIDFEKRLRRMQNHSGEHIVSGISHRLYGCENVGFHMGESFMTIDFDRELSWEQLMKIEALANEAVRENLPVTARFPLPQELKSIDYRSKLELSENVRIVTIEGVDCCACCAPHVKSTGQVGMIKILESQRHRGGVRLSLVCGMDALDNFRAVQDCNTSVSMLLSAKRLETPAAVERLLEERNELKERSAALSMELVKFKAQSCPARDGNICVFDSSLDEVALRELVNALMKKCTGIAAAFSGNDEKGYRYIIGSSSADLKKITPIINSGIGGRGGGRGTMIQGSASDNAENITKFIENLTV